MNKALENSDEGRPRRERQLKRGERDIGETLGDEERNRKVARKVEQAAGSPKKWICEFELGKYCDEVPDRFDLAARPKEECRRRGERHGSFHRGEDTAGGYAVGP